MTETVSEAIEKYNYLKDALSKIKSDNVSVIDYFERITEDNHKLINSRLDHIEKIMDQRFELRDHALSIANKNMELRLDKLNELRNEVVQDRSRYMTTERFEMQHKTIEDRLTKLEMWQSKIIGISIGIGLIAGLAGVIIAKLV